MREPSNPADQPTVSDPITQVAMGAAALHELYLSYVEAGFTDKQALQIVCAIVAAHVHNAGGTAA